MRLTRESDLERVRREGKRIRSRCLEARVSASPLSHPRVGIVVPRYGYSAVLRNRVKRRLREIVRTSWVPRVKQPVDIVVRALPASYEVSFQLLREQMDTLLTRTIDRTGDE